MLSYKERKEKADSELQAAKVKKKEYNSIKRSFLSEVNNSGPIAIRYRINYLRGNQSAKTVDAEHMSRDEVIGCLEDALEHFLNKIS